MSGGGGQAASGRDVAVRRALYDRYSELKGWEHSFRCDGELAGYYSGEIGEDLTGKRVLEIGFGSGTFLEWARSRGASVAGTEVSERLAAAARDAGFEVLAADLPAAAAARADEFDLIVAFDVFEHLEIGEIVDFLRACETLLKEGGRLLVRIPNAQSPFGLIPQYGDATHITPLSGPILTQLASGSALAALDVRPVYPYRGSGLARRTVRAARFACQALIDRLVGFVYAMPTCLAPVVIVEFSKQTGRGTPPQ